MTREKKVGIFVMLGLVITTIVVFLIGENRRIWDPKITYVTSFSNVAGLREGAPVRMGGVDIGSVTKVGHSKDPKDPLIYVEIAVVRKEADRIRTDSVATVAPKGLLGDKMIEITPGAGDPLDPKQPMKSKDPSDLFAALSDITGDAKATLGSIRETAKTLSDPDLAKELRAAVHEIHVILQGVAEKDSPAHRLLMDPQEGQKLDNVLTNLQTTSANLAVLTADARDVTNQLKNGPGLAHALIYDGDMSAHAAGSLAEIHSDLEHIRKGNGLVHALIYGDTDTQHVMTNINAMSDDLRVIVSNLKQGKGTLGALLVDPSVYEDIKSLVGNVERNSVLRALVRYSIKEDEKAHTPK